MEKQACKSSTLSFNNKIINLFTIIFFPFSFFVFFQQRRITFCYRIIIVVDEASPFSSLFKVQHLFPPNYNCCNLIGQFSRQSYISIQFLQGIKRMKEDEINIITFQSSSKNNNYICCHSSVVGRSPRSYAEGAGLNVLGLKFVEINSGK